MTEEKSNAAQFELGKLFVDIGSKGLGGLLKGLTGLQAKFLLSKKSGEEFIKPIKAMSENASNAVVNYDKLHSIMGTAIEDLQDYAKFAKLNNIAPETFLNQVKTAQQQLFKIRAGLDASGQQGLALLGLNPFDFDYNNPIEYIMTVKKKLDSVNPVLRAQVLSMIGWSEEMAYLFDRYDYYLDKQKVKFNDRLLLNEKEMKNLREQNDAWNVLKVTWESAQEKVIANQTWINKLLEKTADWVNSTHPLLSKMFEEFNKFANDPHPVLENILKSMGWAGEKMLELMKNLGEFIGEQKVEGSANIINQKDMLKLYSSNDPEVKRRWEEIKKVQQEKAIIKQSNNVEKTLNAKSVEDDFLPPLPNATPSPATAYLPRSEQNDMSKNVEFTIINNNEINQNISGTDSTLANELGRATEGALSKSQITQAYNQNQIFG